MLEKPMQEAGEVSRRWESGVARAPTLPFMAAAMGSIALSAGLMLTGRRHAATFVGQWVPTLILIGIYSQVARLETRSSASESEAAGVH